MAVGELRLELLHWLNTTLDLAYTKVEQCGTGAAYCQLMDCIYGGIPMHKVKFNTTSEYDYRNNMKILQASFTRNKITKSVETEKLIKCRLQDNLELLQWFKRVWNELRDANDHYDAKAARRAEPPPKLALPQSRNGASATTRPSTTTTSRRSTLNTSTPGSRRVLSQNLSRQLSYSTLNASSGVSANATAKIQQLTKELADTSEEVRVLSDELQEYKISVESLETERNFYFNKLREIEVLTQNIQEEETRVKNGNPSELLEQIAKLTVADITKQIQTILYSTEEGFDDQSDMIDAELF